MYNSLEKIGVKDYIEELEEKRKLEKALESSCKALLRKESSTPSTSSSPSTLTCPVYSPNDKESEECNDKEILDMDGNKIIIDE